jgi:hypothetical protein
VDDVEAFYQQYKDQGLQILWIMSETEQKDQLPSWDWLQAWTDKKGPTFPVLRDYGFAQVYGAVKPATSALPHQYIVDGKTMELVGAFGGLPKEAEELILSYFQ